MTILADISEQFYDLATEPNGMPIMLYGIDVVAQDVRHLILESRLLNRLIAERSADMRKSIYNRLLLVVESHAYILKGSAQIIESSPGIFTIAAQTTLPDNELFFSFIPPTLVSLVNIDSKFYLVDESGNRLCDAFNNPVFYDSLLVAEQAVSTLRSGFLILHNSVLSRSKEPSNA